MSKSDFGTPFSATATGATAAYASSTGVAGRQYFVTDIGVSSDLVTGAGAVIQVLDGSTILWQELAIAVSPVERSFVVPLTCTSGNSVTVKITGTAQTAANVAGFYYKS